MSTAANESWKRLVAQRVLQWLVAQPAAAEPALWRERAGKYFFQCARLFRSDRLRLQHVQRLASLAELLAQGAVPTIEPDQAHGVADDGMIDWLKEVNQLDSDGVVAAFHVLAEVPEEYAESLQEYVYGKLQELFSDPAHLGPGTSPGASALDLAVDVLEAPVALSAVWFQRLVRFVRDRSQRGERDHAADVRALVRLREQIPPRSGATVAADHNERFAQALMRLAQRGREECTEAAFTLLEECIDRRRFFNAVTSQLAVAFAKEATLCQGQGKSDAAGLARQYRDLVESSLAVAELDVPQGLARFRAQALTRLGEVETGVNAPQWMCHLVSSLYDDQGARSRCLEVLTQVADLEVAAEDCREALFHIARSGDPESAAGDYFYLKLIPRALQQGRDSPSAGRSRAGSKALSRLLKVASSLFAEERFERLVRGVMRDVDGASDRARRSRAYVDGAVWLSGLCPPEDPRRKLLQTMSGYHVAQESEAYYSMWINTCYSLLLVSAESPLRQQRCGRMIERIHLLYKEDSADCPAGKSEDRLRGNLEIVRSALRTLAVTAADT